MEFILFGLACAFIAWIVMNVLGLFGVLPEQKKQTRTDNSGLSLVQSGDKWEIRDQNGNCLHRGSAKYIDSRWRKLTGRSAGLYWGN